ncbi:MAG: hypothetical protein RBU30_20185 [Polyangia bacterium]|nr:hypothetical protein [Polyangia bacterium]
MAKLEGSGTGLRPPLPFGSFLALGLFLLLSDSSALGAPPWNTRDELICRGASGVGFSYYWGGGCWCASGSNPCAPNLTGCPAGHCDPCYTAQETNGCMDCTPDSGCCVGGKSCSHSGTYGADCSGFVTKVWQVPNPIEVNDCGHGPYTANEFRFDRANWSVIPRAELLPGDALASSTHVVLYHYGDPWGSLMVYEARGCTYGIVHNSRTFDNTHTASRRINIADCACVSGQIQTEACGLCGTRSRSCQSDCQWSVWSDCTGQGVCSPGQTESELCGFCGTRSRSCVSSCVWGEWTECVGGGDCAPGTIEERDCCDCGSQSRSCDTTSCSWGPWSDCHGPDPAGGELRCDTGEQGICAAGLLRCVEGCLSCERLQEPTQEICNDLDDDCDGLLDNGPPQTLGVPPPPFAARLIDFSYPRRLTPGEESTCWAVFENVGASSWLPGQIWLGAAPRPNGEPSLLSDASSWLAHDVPAIVHEEVPPGATMQLVFRIRAALALDSDTVETFVLLAPSGLPMLCPSPSVTLIVGPRLRSPGASSNHDVEPGPEPGMAASPRDAGLTIGGCGCRAGSDGCPWTPLVLLALFALMRGFTRSKNG